MAELSLSSKGASETESVWVSVYVREHERETERRQTAREKKEGGPRSAFRLRDMEEEEHHTLSSLPGAWNVYTRGRGGVNGGEVV